MSNIYVFFPAEKTGTRFPSSPLWGDKAQVIPYDLSYDYENNLIVVDVDYVPYEGEVVYRQEGYPLPPEGATVWLPQGTTLGTYFLALKRWEVRVYGFSFDGDSVICVDDKPVPELERTRPVKAKAPTPAPNPALVRGPRPSQPKLAASKWTTEDYVQRELENPWEN